MLKLKDLKGKHMTSMLFYIIVIVVVLTKGGLFLLALPFVLYFGAENLFGIWIETKQPTNLKAIIKQRKLVSGEKGWFLVLEKEFGPITLCRNVSMYSENGPIRIDHHATTHERAKQDLAYYQALNK